MKFKELSEESKQKAISDYIRGWLETHENELLNESVVNDILQNNDDVYLENGEFLDHA